MTPGESLRFLVTWTGLSLVIPEVGWGQMPTIGAIEFYGVRTIPVETLRQALGIHEGDSVPEGSDAAIDRLTRISGVERAALDAVCCEAGRITLYVGIQETGAPTLAFRDAPTGRPPLPAKIQAAHEAFETAFAEAIQAGDFAEDDTAGHSLLHFPAARTAQEAFVRLAPRYLVELQAVLRESADGEQRALAARVLAYVPDKRTVVEDLVLATRDPYSPVRNNAVRALALIAGLAQRHPELGIVVPAEPLVDLLNSLVWTDRNKASLALMQISRARDSALFALLKARALPALIEMARWKAPGHALPAGFILGRMGGMADEAIFQAFQQGNREIVIQAATR